MRSKLKLTTITFKTKAGDEITLTMLEAREMHDQLHELFGDKNTLVTAPVYIYPDPPRTYPRWQDVPYCSASGSISNTSQITGLTATYNGTTVE